MFYNGYLGRWAEELRKLNDALDEIDCEFKAKSGTNSQGPQETLDVQHDKHQVLSRSNPYKFINQEHRRLIRKRLNPNQQQKLRQEKDMLFNVAIQMLDYLDREMLGTSSTTTTATVLNMARSYVNGYGASSSEEHKTELEAVYDYMHKFSQHHNENVGSLVVSIGRLEAKRRSLKRGFPLDMKNMSNFNDGRINTYS